MIAKYKFVDHKNTCGKLLGERVLVAVVAKVTNYLFVTGFARVAK